MRKLLVVAMGVITLCGCASESAPAVANDKSSAAQANTKEWKEFVAPLSVKTQTPFERMIKRTER